MKSGVYKITNIINTKIYIGSSAYIPGRWKNHLKGLKNNKHENTYLQRAFNLHGEENFKWEVIETCPKVKVILLKKEQYWINFYKSSNRKYGYNLSPTAGSVLGIKRTEETKQKISLAKKGVPMSDEAKLNMSKARKGKKRTEEQNNKQSEAQKGKPSPMKGRKHTEETKQLMSLAKKGIPRSEEVKQKMSIAQKGRHLSKETKQRMSLAHIGVPLSEEHRKNVSIALTGKPSLKKGKKYPKKTGSL